MSVEHNHEITKDAFDFHPANRILPDELKERAIDMLNTGSKASAVALLMSEKKQKGN
jgi:hypothetical protein